MANINIDQDIEEVIGEKIEQTEFDSIEEYVNFVLREVIEADLSPETSESPDRDKAVQEQLEDLGYL